MVWGSWGPSTGVLVGSTTRRGTYSGCIFPNKYFNTAGVQLGRMDKRYLCNSWMAGKVHRCSYLYLGCLVRIGMLPGRGWIIIDDALLKISQNLISFWFFFLAFL